MAIWRRSPKQFPNTFEQVSIQFTREDEGENKLPFLDVLMERSGRKISTCSSKKVLKF